MLQLRHAAVAMLAATAIGLATLAPGSARAKGDDAGPAYTDADYAPYAPGRSGTGSISGSLVLRGPSRPIAAASALVVAFPDTPYTRWYLAKRVDAMKQEGGVLPHQRDDGVISYVTYDDKIVPYLRTTTSDGAGRFTFAHLPAGSYVVVAQFATVATKYMPKQGEDSSYGANSVDDFLAPPLSEFPENYFYFWMLGSKPVTVGARAASVGALPVFSGYFCGMLQQCSLVNDFSTKGENQGDKLNRALGIGAKHGYEKRRLEPVANPNDGLRAGF